MIRSIALAFALAASAAVAAPVGIASGQQGGTNYPMANDIASVCSTAAAPIHNVESNGSLDNIAKIYTDKNTQYGIIQADALVYMKGQDPKMMERIQMVFPFFSTEIHLISKAGSPIRSLSDLAGKRVVEGPEGSGTWVTVQVIKQLTGLSWTPVAAGVQDGFNQVKAGQADAEFLVAGAPVSMLKNSTGYKLVPLSHPKLDAFGLYTKTMIPSGMYPSVGVVNTYKVDNVLATYAFKNQYQREIGDLVSCITRNIGRLQSESQFHAKWRDVSPEDINRVKWQVHPAAKAAVERVIRSQQK
jgi:TRAP transporter TAXI family solute receptor